MRLPRPRFVLAVLGILLPATAWPQGAMGPEFRLNAYTTDGQFLPAVASDGNGDFVAVWTSPQDGSSAAIVGRRFDTTGAPRGAEFLVNAVTQGGQTGASAAASADGSFVVVWEYYGADGSNEGVVGRRFNAAGVPLTADFPINAYTTHLQYFADVAADGAGNFVAVWASAYQDGHGVGVFGRRFNAAGAPVGPEFQVNTYTLLNQFAPAVASTPAGTFVVAWQGQLEDGDQYGIFARRYDATGTPLGAPFPVNTYTTDTQERVAVAIAPNGTFVIAWDSRGQDGSYQGVVARRFSGAGIDGPEFQVNTYTTGPQWTPSVAIDRDGAFMITWRSFNQDGSQFGVFGRQYDANGNPTGGDFRVNTFTPNSQELPAMAAVARGDFVVAWQSSGQDGSNQGVYGQRYGDLIFRDGVETGDVSRWTSAETDGGDLSVAPEAALGGTTQGLQALVDDVNPLFVRDDSPAAEDHYRARFYCDTNGFDPGEATNNRRVRLLIAFNAANQRLATIVLRRVSGQYAVMGRVRLDDGTRADTGFFPISDGPHMVELRWQRASATPDGFFILRIDDVQVSSLTGLDNGDSPVDYARMGVMSIKSAAATGTMYFDQFESRRARRIGPE